MTHSISDQDLRLILKMRCDIAELTEYLEDAIKIYHKNCSSGNDELTISVPFFAGELKKDLDTLFQNVCESYICTP